MSLFKSKIAGMCATVALILGAWTAPLMAEGFNFGVTGAYTILFTEAQEKNQEGTLGPRGQGDTTEEALLPSVFLEYNFAKDKVRLINPALDAA